MPLPRILRDLLNLPTAAFCETAVMEHLEAACGRLAGVTTRFDRAGNLLAHYRHQPREVRPLAFMAHTDHPGFVAQEMLTPATVRAEFRGGVGSNYFSRARVRFWSDGKWVQGRVLEVTRERHLKGARWPSIPEEAVLRVKAPVRPDSPGMWDLPDPVLDGDLVRARGCDDIGGVAAMLALLRRLSRRQQRAEVYCLFTRAEEVGFVGAVAAARAGTVPKRVPIISIETSTELPNAPIGAGPILRVGDRACIFSPALTAFCDRVGKKLAGRRKTFTYQRRLMDGGKCEAYPMISYGYAATGICVALGNYHNMDTRRGKIGSEYISLKDWQRMVDFFEALVLDDQGPDCADDAGRIQIDKAFESREHLLYQPRPGF
jgi:putative aminopeptidase FrvX